jgi:WD40 repeat protein
MTLSRIATVATLVVLAWTPWNPLRAEEAKPGPAQGKVTYAEHVRPIFREHCLNCHNQTKKQNDLALDRYETVMTGGASGEAIKPGDPDNSYLYTLVTHKDTPHMPPNQDRLPDAKLEVIRQWIAGGALKDSGSTAKAKKEPAVELALASGAGRPGGTLVMPEGVTRQPVVSTARPGACTALTASPWAPLVAVAGQKQISLYQSDSLELAAVLPFPEGIPYVLKFSRSGSLLLAGGGRGASRGLAAVYDVRSGKRLFAVGDELDAVLAADITADHRRVALGGPQRLVRVFLAADGSQAYEINKHTDWITALEFSPDGVLLATADRAGGISIWEAETGREYSALAGHKEAVAELSWRADSNVLASASQDGTIKLWNMEDGRQIRSINAHAGGATGVQFARDGRLVTCGRDNQVKVWDASGRQLQALSPFSDVAMCSIFTHDGARVVAGDWTGEIRVWQTADGKLIGRLAANPPTLQMVAAAAVEAAQKADRQAASAKEEAEKLAAQQGHSEKQLAEKRAAAKAAADAAAAARAVAEKAMAEKERFEKTAPH